MRRFLTALPFALLLLPVPGSAAPMDPSPPAAAAAATNAESFTPAQRSEIVHIVREALKSDPSILRDAVAALQADEGLRQDAAARGAIAGSRHALVHDATDPVAGNPAGDVTVIEFFDVRCPYCRHMQPVMEQLLRADHGVRLVLKDLPVLGAASTLGARALLAAERQGGYLRLQDLLLRSGPPSEASLRDEATALGLDWARMQQDMADPAIQQKIDANLALARRLGIDGTPAFIVGGKLISGEVELAELQRAIAEARAEPHARQ